MKIHMAAEGFELTSELEKYASGKLAQLAKQVPRKLRQNAGCTVHFSQSSKKGVKLSTCSLALSLEGIELNARETTQHVYAALDIAAVHVEQQLKDYLQKYHKHSVRTRLKRHFGTD